MGTVLTPILCATAGTSRSFNPGMAETYSWLPVEGEALGRPLYARASYVTNFSDMSINLSASELSIGAVTLKDNNSGLNADVVDVPGYGAGLQVLTQDLESTIDDVTIGDKRGYYATVNPVHSALNVNIVAAAPAPVTYADNATIDAFQRLRISEPVTLFDSKQLHQMSTLFWSNTALNGNVYHAGVLDPSIILSVSADGGYAIRQTTQRFYYQSGKSLLYMFTGTLCAICVQVCVCVYVYV